MLRLYRHTQRSRAFGLIMQVAVCLMGPQPASGDVRIFQTTREGDRLRLVRTGAEEREAECRLQLHPEQRHQTILGIGASVTEASAQVLSELTSEKRAEVLVECFGREGAGYSMTRTHIGSCDFSVRPYSHAPVPDDVELKCFSIEPDRKYLLPVLKEAGAVPGADFKILASPWTAPPWMKTNHAWNGGKLKKEHYATFAKQFVKYIRSYREEGVRIWGVTPENEPLGNGSNWESMEFTAEEMREFIADHLGPVLEKEEPGISIWAYDQNRDRNLETWADVILADPAAARHVDGLAVHWYQSTRDVGAEMLAKVAAAHPGIRILHSEGCIDAIGDDEPIGSWLEDDWYWREEATDWGYRWAPDHEKADHPKYRPFHRVARDLIGGFNAGLVAWVEWNLALNTRGGPNHARNFCVSPILVDSGRDRVFFTPLFAAISHVSRFVRPGAVRIGLSGQTNGVMATAFRNEDGTLVVVAFNPTDEMIRYSISLRDQKACLVDLPAQAMQTVILTP